ncbi:DUF4431 domain-containing protein [Yersinia wautersii]|uniref:DUF4431 domain-containing protein n=1 Tax=Yersinia wautersii TaxID=1341643 RepID=A0ABM9TLC8_9GAMM|nr:DUF4431 domain-containing protein [Yersinia wautersii]CRG52637.1 Uncharacterised protein [Yersinia wautersii]
MFLCHSVFAYCPDENLQVTLQGKLVEHIYPGPPNWESIKGGDEAVKNDFLQLDAPFECDIATDEESVSDVQLIFLRDAKTSSKEAQNWLNKNVIVTGKTMYAQTGWHYTTVLLLVDEVKEIPTTLTPEQKKEMLVQFLQFQQALKEKKGAELKSYFVFPLTGDTGGLLQDSEPEQPGTLTEAVFERYAVKIIESLQPLSKIIVNPDDLTIKQYRVNALSAEEQKRHYFFDDKDGVFYYKENGQRHLVEGACDTVADGEFYDDSLTFHQGTEANKQIPGLSQNCDGASSFTFQLIDGKLRLMSSFTAG